MNLYLELLEKEIECLRSVISEWEYDKNVFSQMHAANAFAEARNHLVRPNYMFLKKEIDFYNEQFGCGSLKKADK